MTQESENINKFSSIPSTDYPSTIFRIYGVPRCGIFDKRRFKQIIHPSILIIHPAIPISGLRPLFFPSIRITKMFTEL